MNRLTPLLLLLLVTGLGLAIWFETEREDPPMVRVEVPLFEGLVVGDLTRIRIDNIERSIHLSIDRDASGRWFLTDPIAYPVRKDMLVQLLGILGRNEGWTVPDSEHDSVHAAMARPRALLELFTGEGGETLAFKLEMGPVDVDAQRVNAIVDGQVLRTMRNLETVVETSVLDWRSRGVFDIAYDGVVEIRREGFDPLPEESVDLTLLARRDGAGWWLDRPVRLNLDPGYMQGWSGMLTRVQVRHFLSDTPEPDLAAWGLAPASFTLTLVDRNGREEVLEVGKPALSAPGYFARRRGSQFVWELDERDFSMIFHQPDKLFDHVIARLPRDTIEVVLLRGARWTIRLTQDLAEGDWTVAWKPVQGEGEWTIELPAAEETVDRVLTPLRDPDTIAAYLWQTPKEDYFPDGAPVQAIWLEQGGLRHGGRVGPIHVTEAGTRSRTFLREKESAVSLVPLEVGDLLELLPEDFISLQLTQLSEPTLQRIEISRGERLRRYIRTIQTTWIHADLKSDALPELLPVIEHLLYLKALGHVQREDSVALLDVVTVRIFGRAGAVTQVDVGRTASGEVRAQMGSRQSVLKHQALHADLLRITE